MSARVLPKVAAKVLLELKNHRNLSFLGYYSKANMEEWEIIYLFMIILECVYLVLLYINFNRRCVHAFL